MRNQAKRASTVILSFSLSCASATWIERGPSFGGRLSAIVASPTDANTLLVASPGGGVWRTTNNGASWQLPLNYALADFSVVHLEWDRIRPGILYASTYSDLYSTSDLGEHWSNLTHFGGHPAQLMPQSHVSDPKPFAQLKYSATQSTIFWGQPCTGLYYSNDGSTFTHHWPFMGGPTNPDNCLAAIAADDATGKIYIATMARSGTAHLFRSLCAWTAAAPCLVWENANSGLPTGIATSLVWGGSAGKLAAATTVSTAAVIYLTSDGTHWTAGAGQPPSPNWDARPLAWPGANQLLLGTVVAYQSTDWGGSWNNVWFSGMHPDVRSFYWANYGAPTYLWTTTDGASSSGTYANITRWNWTPGSAPTGGEAIPVSGLKVWQSFYLAATGQSGSPLRRLFLGALDNGGLCSDDGGANWTTAGVPSNGCGDQASMVFAPSNPSRAYARTCDGVTYLRSDNAYGAANCAAVTWTAVAPAGGHSTPSLWTRAMTAVHPSAPDTVYFARLLDVAASTDGGNTWTNHPLPGGAMPVSVFVDAAGAVYAGTIDHGAYVSTDGGGNWNPFGLNTGSPRAVLNIAHSTAGGAGGTFFLATTGGLYRKLPAGGWTLQSIDPSYVVSDVEVDPACPTRVYSAFGYAADMGQHRGGVEVSKDNGSSFSSITSGLAIHQSPIADIQVDPVDSRYLHAGVFGRGAWTYDLGATPSCP